MKKILSLLLFAALFTSVISCTADKPAKKPNIIFLFADDQCYNTINATGNSEIITPHLDKLVNNGAYFAHNFNMGAWNGAVCIASRTMINTGRSVWKAHAIEKQLKKPEYTETFWGNLMKNAGYETYMTGKWHVKADAQKMFSNVGTVRSGMPKQTDERYNRTFTEEGDEGWKPWKEEYGGFWQGGKHWTEVLGDEALGFIEDTKTKDKPFFMYLAFNAPHDPRQSPKEFVDMYPLENIAVPETFMPEYPNQDKIGNGPALRDERLAPFPRTEHSVKVNRQEYYAIITHLDQQIGRIMEALKASGEMDNTYIFYTADHGLACGNHGLIGKQSLYDHSTRSPLIVIGPDIPKGSKVEADVYLQDIMPTALELAGAEKPAYVEFSSLLALAKGEKETSAYDAIYGCYRDLQRSIRKDGYKLIVYPEVPQVLLYDLNNDPKEMTDISANHQDKVKTMFAELLKLQREMEDPLDITSIFPEFIK